VYISSFEEYLQVFQQLKSMNSLQIEGMENLINSLDTFLDNTSITSIDNDDSFIRLYKSATLQSTDIIHADASYNNTPWFSDVAIVMDTNETIHYTTDQGACFGKVSNNINFYSYLSYRIPYILKLDIVAW